MRDLHRILIVAIAATLLSVLPVQAAEPGRISLVQGEVLSLDSDQSEWIFVDPGTPAVEGDLYWLAPDALLEIELPRGITLRAGPDSRFEITRLLPTPEIRIASGALYLCSRKSSPSLAIQVQTPAIQIDLPRRSKARIDVNALGNTRVTAGGFVDWRIADQQGFLSSNQRIYVQPGLLPSAITWDFEHDEFDTWTERACNGIQTEEWDIVGAGSLQSSGRWTRVDGLRVWIPRVDPTWFPYSNGQWHWLTGHGWSWVPEEPWGWATHHYGSWSFLDRHGWIWRPDHQWHGGRVHWIHIGGHLFWTAIGSSGSPITRTSDSVIQIGNWQVSPELLCAAGRTDNANRVLKRADNERRVHDEALSQGGARKTNSPPQPAHRSGRVFDPVLGDADGRADSIAARARSSRKASSSGFRSHRVTIPGSAGATEPKEIKPKAGLTILPEASPRTSGSFRLPRGTQEQPAATGSALLPEARGAQRRNPDPAQEKAVRSRSKSGIGNRSNYGITILPKGTSPALPRVNTPTQPTSGVRIGPGKTHKIPSSRVGETKDPSKEGTQDTQDTQDKK